MTNLKTRLKRLEKTRLETRRRIIQWITGDPEPKIEEGEDVLIIRHIIVDPPARKGTTA